jgi:tetratricopeptide (TPR) repeat protein
MSLNPNDYYNYCFEGWLAACSGDLEHAIVCSNEALRRSPLVPDGCLHTRVLAEYLAKNYVEAITAFARMVRPDPLVHARVAAAYAQLGRIDEARSMARQFLQRVSELPWIPKGDDPLEWRKYWDTEFRSRDQAARSHLFDGLGKAGLPV